MEMYFRIKYILDSDDYSEVEELEEISKVIGLDISNNSSFFEWLLKDNYFNHVTTSSEGVDEFVESLNEVLDYPIIISTFRAEYGISEHDFWNLSVPEYKRLLLGLQLTDNALSKLTTNRNIKSNADDDAKVKAQNHIIRETYRIKSTNKTKDRLNHALQVELDKKRKLRETFNERSALSGF